MKDLSINYRKLIGMYMKVRGSFSAKIHPLSQIGAEHFDEKQVYYPRINRELSLSYGKQFFILYTEKDNYIGKRYSYKIEVLGRDYRKVKKLMEHHFIVPLKKDIPYENEFANLDL